MKREVILTLFVSLSLLSLFLISADVIENTTTECGKSESGKNYYVRGGFWEERCNYLEGEWLCTAADGEDTCQTDMVLYEGYCENNKLVGEEITCRNGCVEGACVKETFFQRILIWFEKVFSSK